MRFGLYLHRKGVITADELVAALEVQTKRLVRIGQLALEEGILSARDIFDVLRAQQSTPHERFGELAIELGRMTHNDLMRLLRIQADRKLPLDEILVWQGVLSRPRADDELNAFRHAQYQPRRAVTKTIVVPAPHVRAAEHVAVDASLAI